MPDRSLPPPAPLSQGEHRQRVERVVQHVLREHFESCSMLEHDRREIAAGNADAIRRARVRGEHVGGLLEALALLTRPPAPDR